MLKQNELTGNQTDNPDFLKVLLTLKANIMKDLNVCEICKVIDISKDNYIVNPINNTKEKLYCKTVTDSTINKGDLVLVIFTNSDYRLNLKKIKAGEKPQEVDQTDLHSRNYGVIIATGSSTPQEVYSKVYVDGNFVETFNANTKADVSELNKEISDRKNADSTLQTNIDNETTNRETADKTLQSNIDEKADISDLNNYLLKSGGVMTGPIKFNINSTNNIYLEDINGNIIRADTKPQYIFGNDLVPLDFRGVNQRPTYKETSLALITDVTQLETNINNSLNNKSNYHSWNVPSSYLSYSGTSATTHTIDISSLTGDTSGAKVYEVIWVNESYCTNTAYLRQYSDYILDFGISNQRFSTNGRQGGNICNMLVKRYLYYTITNSSLGTCYNSIVAWREVSQ